MEYGNQHLDHPKAIQDDIDLYTRAKLETKQIRDYFKTIGCDGFPLDIEGFTVTILRNNKNKGEYGD